MRLLIFEKDIKEGIYTYLGGGNSNIFWFHPEPWGNNPIDGAYMFQMGWFNSTITGPILKVMKSWRGDEKVWKSVTTDYTPED